MSKTRPPVASPEQTAIADKLHELALSGKTGIENPIPLGQRYTLIIMADPWHPHNNNGRQEYAFQGTVSENDVDDGTGVDRIVCHGQFQSDYNGEFWLYFHIWERGDWERFLLALTVE